jgi:predicted metal-dependent peptidase
MVVIDTSGSITDALLAQIAKELAVIGSSRVVVVVECDAAVRRVYPFKGELRDVCGRGGTDFRPPFDRTLLAKLRPDVVVYFTDGEGLAPLKPPRVPVLWCLTAGANPPAAWGHRVWMR